ncbi:MAG: bifunctional phosphoribosylaminoimidazolecarboxamide formyltransferase/IMP cyclohydrolase [Pseudomonadota bacterium]|nr:bifunctional phosphoribosylaminoimidazolecarboxamide formyltransferase/IMP cyclohydrolase [Pseudomonadota bacterium]
MTHYALLSVSDKTGIINLAQALIKHGYSLLSTGGTYLTLTSEGIKAIEISSYTNMPEMFEGRIKTLHPKIHGGLLALPDDPSHAALMHEHGIEAIDIAVVNLYPFIQTIAKADTGFSEAIEQIDIGGPTIIRAAAKNHKHVTIMTHPDDYKSLIVELDAHNGLISDNFRLEMAKKAFSYTAAYDGAISNYLTSLNDKKQRQLFPNVLNIQIHLADSLRYGENPHQVAAYYRDSQTISWRQLQGKPLSFNNISDADTAWRCVNRLNGIACVIIKHANPCGAAISDTSAKAYHMAYSSDPVSAFGGIIALNQELDEATAELISKQFAEVVIAPHFSEKALSVFSSKPSLRLIQPDTAEMLGMDIRRLNFGWLLQSFDDRGLSESDLAVVTQLAPAENQMHDLLFAWNIVQDVKSNAIVLARGNQTIGIGAGQVSRVDSVRVAITKAQQAGISTQGAVLASDAFFPFDDGIKEAAQAGVRTIIQPGGSIRDPEIIATANTLGLTMVFTGIRHFRH